MAIRYVHRRRRGNVGASSAFTLIELIVALAVVSVAATVFISLFTSSISLAQSTRNRTLAASLAEAQLHDLLHYPGRFVWDFPSGAGLMDPFLIRLSEDEPKAGNAFDAPAILPADPSAVERESALPGRFRWQAMGRLPSLNAAFYEVTVVVQWEEAARPQLLTLTSSIPKFMIPEAPETPEAETAADALPEEDAS